MVRNIIKIKNISKTPRSIRPYKDRNVLVTFSIGETKEIDVLQCSWDVKRNPTAYFKYLGFTVVTNGVPVKKFEPPKTADAPKPVEPAKSGEPKITEQVKPQQPTQLSDAFKFKAEDGDFKHYNASSSQWQGLRKVRDWVLDRIIYDGVKGLYYQVTSLDGDQMVCKPLTEDEAVVITGTKAN